MFNEKLKSIKDAIKCKLDYQITMFGNGAIYIEGHKGIKTYTKENIKLKTHKNYILITGAGLEIKEINDVDIMINGIIDKVELSVE